MAANATAGKVDSISVSTNGDITFTINTKADNFSTDFLTFYGVSDSGLNVSSMSAWKGSNWAAKGGEWTSAAGWEINK